MSFFVDIVGACFFVVISVSLVSFFFEPFAGSFVTASSDSSETSKTTVLAGFFFVPFSGLKSSFIVSGGQPSFFFRFFSPGFVARVGLVLPISAAVTFHASGRRYRIGIPSKSNVNISRRN